MENFKKIESKTLEEHKNELERQFHIFKLSYIERLYDKKIPPLEESFIDIKYGENDEIIEKEIKINTDDFNMLLGRYTDILRSFVIAHKKIENPDSRVGWTDEEYDAISKIYIEKIKEFYRVDKTKWIENTMLLLDEMNNKLKNEKIENLLDDDRSGLISTEIITDQRLENILKNTNIPFNKYDKYLELHLRPLVELQYGKSEVNIFSEDSLKQLALDIVDKYGEVKGIIGQSWILDTPIAERIGFKQLKKTISMTPSFWGQFQDAKGQLVKERINKLLETGKPPYMVVMGIIDVIDFLKKYLPNERKGEVILKEKNEDFDYKSFNDTNIKGNLMRWDDMSLSEVENYIESNKFLKMFFETEEGKNSKDLFIKLKKENIKLENLRSNQEWQDYAQKFNKFIDSLMFKEKKVFIE